MNVKLVLTITILSMKVTQGEQAHFVSTLVPKISFFHKSNIIIHTTVNKIFNSLRLLKYFSKSNQKEELLKIHNKFLNVAEKQYDVYEYLKNISNANFTVGDYQRKFLESLNEIIMDGITKHKSKKNKTLNNEQNNTAIEKGDESIEFLDKFVDKFSKLTMENLTNYKTNVNRRNGRIKLLIKSKNYELKAWNSTFPNGTQSNLTRRLYKARSTRIKNYPFLVSIHVLDEFICSGSIISKDLVVTAASCLQIANNNYQSPGSVFVRTGSDYTKAYGQVIPVTEIFFHPQYNPKTLYNNIAIMRMKKHLKLSSKKGRIRRIKYNKEIKKHTEGVYVLGWGARNARDNPHKVLRLAVDYLDLYSFRDCQEIYTRRYVTHKNFCAGFIDKGAGACNRDVGGPGFRDGTLVGIISFGPPVCGKPNSPTVFTDIGYYGTWIASIVRRKLAFQISKSSPVATKTVETTHIPRTPRPRHELLHTTPLTTPKVSDDYPEEVMILKEILQDIVMTNSSIVENILYDNTLGNKILPVLKKAMDNNITNVHRFVNLSKDPVLGLNNIRHKVNPDVKAHTAAVKSDSNENVMISSNEMTSNNSSDVSENYEEQSDHEQEIDIGIGNFSFLDVLLNVQKFKFSQNPNIQDADQIERDLIGVKLIIESRKLDTDENSSDDDINLTKDEKTIREKIDVGDFFLEGRAHERQ